ncbi:MAG: hypothetical protein ACREI8_05475, partial [Myxococcota bacterium]
METIYLWPDRPAFSLLAIWVISSIALWAAREPMRELVERLGKSLEESFERAGRRCKAAAEALQKRSRTALLAAGGLDLQGKLEKEFHRIEAGFSERLSQYSGLHRKLDELLQRFESDYQQSGASPPEVPGWTAAVESIAGIPNADDPNVQEILEGVRKSLDEAQRQALHAYRADSAERHGILDRMRSLWKEVRVLLDGMSEAVAGAMETAARINAYIDDYARVRDDDHIAARALTYSATKLFAISLLVMGVALGGAFVNFQLLALPMAELLPAGAQLGGVAVGKVAALAIVGLQLVLGVFARDLLGITELLPRLARVQDQRRRWLIGLTLAGLFVFAASGSALAEHAALGFVLPFVVALAAVPLELLLDSGRHVVAFAVALLVSGIGSLAFVMGRGVHTLATVLPSVYD